MLFIVLFFLNSIHALEKKDTTFFPYGLAQYRFTLDCASVKNKADNQSFSFNSSNKFGIHFGFAVNLSRHFLFQFQFGNDWSLTDKINFPFDNPSFLSDKSYSAFSFPCFHLVFFECNWKSVYLAVGKIPLINFGPLNLLERSLSTGTYNGAALIGWHRATNNSIFGLKSGVHIFSKPFHLSAELFTTTIDTTKRSVVFYGPDPTSFLFVLNLFLRSGAFSLTPQFALITNKYFSPENKKNCHEFGLGFTATYAVNKDVKLSIINGWTGSFSRFKSDHSDSIDTSNVNGLSGNIRGFEIGFGSSVKVGPGILIFDTKYSNSLHMKVNGSINHFLYNNLQYILRPHPQISITPSIGVFLTIHTADPNLRYFLMRPELTFTGQI